MHFAAYRCSVKGIRLLHRYSADLNAIAHVVDNEDGNDDGGISCKPLDIIVGGYGLAAKVLRNLGAESLHLRPGTGVTCQESESDGEFSPASSIQYTPIRHFVRRCNMKLDPEHHLLAQKLPFLPALVMRDIVPRPKPPPYIVPRLKAPHRTSRPAWSTSSSSRSVSPASPTFHHSQVPRSGGWNKAGILDPLFSRLCDAAVRGDLEACESVKAAGFSIDGPLSCGCAPLCWAITTGNVAIATWLLDQNADIDALPCYHHGQPHRRQVGIPWLIATSFDASLTRLLGRALTAYLENGRSIFNENRENPVHAAVMSKNIHALRAIIEHIRENQERHQYVALRMSYSVVLTLDVSPSDAKLRRLHVMEQQSPRHGEHKASCPVF